MWIHLAILSAAVLGLYEVAKKHAIEKNAVLPVLTLSTALGSMLFLPAILFSGHLTGTRFYVPQLSLNFHLLILLKTFIVGSSWILGYFGLKKLPISVAMPVGTLGPVFTIIGSILLFGEQLNSVQWLGLGITLVSYFLLTRVSSEEGIVFRNNKWIALLVGAALLHSFSTLYDKWLIPQIGAFTVQVWASFYMAIFMAAVTAVVWYPRRHKFTGFSWRWSIPLITILLAIADYAYYHAVFDPAGLLAIIGPIRRCNIAVAFVVGGLLFHEVNLRRKGGVLALMLAGIVLVFAASGR
jgi:transporter family protein